MIKKQTINFFKIIIVFILLSISFYGNAKVKLPVIISDGMVLQREQDIKIWGWADVKEEIRITFMGKQYQTHADEKGDWFVVFSPMDAGGPYSMTINDIELNDILIGDVWFCSGQSNMELPIRRVMDLYKEEVNAYENSAIRHIKIPLTYDFHHPSKDINPASWKELNPENALDFSAVACFFAKDLYKKTNVPIGLINSSVGGSPVEAWISENGLADFPKYVNEKRMCESDEYVSSTKNLERKERNLWNEITRKNDLGLQETIKWHSTEYDDSSWDETDLFETSWATDGLNPVNGTFWFRKEIEIKQELPNDEIVLRMGCIVDADSVFINGILVGTTAYQYPPRIYKVPRNVLKKGKNVVTVHLTSYSNYPHFVKDKPYKLIMGNEEICLEGMWKYKQGTRMPFLKNETFFQYKPTGLYNSMISPLQNYGIKGALWYQGESNTERYNDYYGLMSALISNWRTQWNQPDLPFLVVQLANFMQPSEYPSESDWAELRDVQLQLSKNIPNTGLAVAIDIGEWNDIHPLNKKDIGKRLSLQAQRIAYKNNNIVADGPVYESSVIKGNKIIISFKKGTDDFLSVDKLNGFAIAGEDERFHWAEAVMKNGKIIVWNDNITSPKKVRYAWGDNPEDANLKNKSGLSASPFQTK